MAYGNFKTVEEVAIKFDIEVTNKMTFVVQKELSVLEPLFSMIAENINDSLSFINEATICERIVSPILNIVSKNYKRLNVWSHVPYNIDYR